MDHYEILGVSPIASDAVIRVAYRQRLKEVHPDTGHSDPSEFEAVLAAGAVLLEPAGRDSYDERRSSKRRSARRRGGSVNRGTVRVMAGVLAAAVAAILLFMLAPWSSGSEVADEVRGASVLSPTLLVGGDDAEDEDRIDESVEPTVAPAQPDADVDEDSEPAQIVAIEDADDSGDEDTETTSEDSGEDASSVESVDAATDDASATENAAAEATAEDNSVEEAEAEEAAEASADDDQATADDLPALADLPERGAIYRAPTLFLVGPVPSQEIADAFYAKAVAVLGEENVVNEYIVHPDAPTDLNGNVRVEQAITFETASATIRPEFVPVLGLAFEVLTQNPQASLVIEGHTDSVGEATTNQILSEARANAVVSWLAERGIEPGRLTAIGYGESEPVADNLTEAGRSINRRIEVQITDLLS